MKRIVNILGITHRKGISKESGKPYDFHQVHCLFEDEATVGHAAISLILPDREVAHVESIGVGSMATLYTSFVKGKGEYYTAMLPYIDEVLPFD